MNACTMSKVSISFTSSLPRPLRRTLLDAELRDHDIERLVEHADDRGRPDDGSVALREVGNEDAKEEVCRLLLREASGVLLDVARLRDLGDGLGVESKLGIVGCEDERSDTEPR